MNKHNYCNLSYQTDLVLYHEAFKGVFASKECHQAFSEVFNSCLFTVASVTLSKAWRKAFSTSSKPANFTLFCLASTDLCLFSVVLKLTLLFYLTTMHISISWSTESLIIRKHLWSTAWQIVTEWATWTKRCLLFICQLQLRKAKRGSTLHCFCGPIKTY